MPAQVSPFRPLFDRSQQLPGEVLSRVLRQLLIGILFVSFPRR
jgi:hypothetical protein